MCLILNVLYFHSTSHSSVGKLLHLSNEGARSIKNDDPHLCPNLQNAISH